MKKLLFYLAVMFLAANAFARVKYPYPPEEEKFIKKIQTLFIREDFDIIDRIAKKCRLTKARFPGGDWKIMCLYVALGKLDRNGKLSNHIWRDHEVIFDKWIDTYPESITARVGLAKFLCSYAWKARGGGWASSVKKKGWKLFRKRLEQAEEVLNDAKKLKEKCPYWWMAMQTVALGQGWDRQRYDKLFEEAIAFEPMYWDYYYSKAHFLLPRWRGKEGEWEKFADSMRKKIGGKEGLAVYAYICHQMSFYFKKTSYFQTHDISWQKMKKGFFAIEELYGTSNRHVNQFCKYACLAGDKKTALGLFEWIGEDWDKTVWRMRSRFDKFRKWMYSEEKPPTKDKINPDSRFAGMVLKDYNFKDINGKYFKFSRLKSRRTLMNIWSVRSSDCEKEATGIVELCKKYPRKELSAIVLSYNKDTELQEFAQKFDIRFPIISIKTSLPYPFSEVVTVPTTFIVNNDGIILDVLEGYYPAEEIEKRIRQ